MNILFLIGYVGPGIGMSALGVFLALVGGFFLAIAGFVWYPIKRLLRTLRNRNSTPEDEQKSE